jgi:hypothetical protein
VTLAPRREGASDTSFPRLARFESGAVLLFRTDLDGDIALLSDGERLWADASR